MSQESNASNVLEWRQRRRRTPPTRLSWPASNGSEVGQSEMNKQPPARKRQRTRGSSSLASSSSKSPSSASNWVEKHAPTSIDELCVAPKKIKEVRSWLERAATPFGGGSKLLILVGSPGIGKSTMIRLLAKTLDFSVCDWNEVVVPNTSGEIDDDSQGFSIEPCSALQSFELFLQQAGAGLQCLSLQSTQPEEMTKDSIIPQFHRSLILLDDLPHLHSSYAEERFREIMGSHLRQSLVPTVLIFSDVSEGKHRPRDLERLIEPIQLYCQDMVQILQVHNVTKSKMKKILRGIAERERIQVPTSSVFWDRLHDQCGGDLRHSILTLQLEVSGCHRSRMNDNDKDGRARDFRLSSFHALGRLLYAKRNFDPTTGSTTLAFDPEETMERSDMGLGGSLGFLLYHSPGFYTDIGELSNAMEYFSDASLLLDSHMDYNRRDSLFPTGYVGSLAGRAVACTNSKPTPNKFRQFSSPKSFEVMRKRQQNEVAIQHLFRRMSTSAGSLHWAISASETLVTDTLPCLRLIAPNDVNPSIDSLYTTAQSVTVDGAGRSNFDDPNASEDERMLRVQEEILQEDDIVEDGSDFSDAEDASFI